MNPSISISDQRRLLEISAVILTGIGKFVFMDWLNIRFAYISIACVFWIVYIGYRIKENPAIATYWGLTNRHFKQSFFELLPIAVVLLIAFIYIGKLNGTNVLNWYILPILLLYPIWGIIQQFIMIGIIARNMKDVTSVKLPTIAIILITALSFSLVHYPNTLLMLGTFFLALVYTSLYLKNRNVIVMGIYHGWIGAFFYATILARDPWQELFGHLSL